MTGLSKFTVALDCHQIGFINLSSRYTKSLLLIFQSSIGRLVVLRGISDRDNTNWSWQDETDRFNKLLAKSDSPNTHIALECDYCFGWQNEERSIEQYHLYCLARSDYYLDDDGPYDVNIVEFKFLVGENVSPDNFTVELG